MKKIIPVIYAFSILIWFSATSFTRIQNNPDKATIYFVRTKSMGSAVKFKYFIDDNFIGKSKYGTYFKIEVDPGVYVIWAKSETTSYLLADVEAGKTYVINAVAKMGGIKADVVLEAVDGENEKELSQVIKYFDKKKVIVFSDNEIENENQEKIQEIITKGLNEYELYQKNNPELEQLNTELDPEVLGIK
jgi:hypothetical protein